jgi:uncharacterized radical SAM superfamily protein
MEILNGAARRAWETRRENFGEKIYFFAPSLKRYDISEFKARRNTFFVPISITGSACQLSCDHCRGKILEGMLSARDPRSLWTLGKRLSERGCRGLLITGGSLKDGRVPLIEFMPAIGRLKSELGLKIAVHTGLVDERLADELAGAEVDVAMVDIIGSEETVGNIYHLRASLSDFENTLEMLIKRGIRVSPHVVIGLHWGKIIGEKRALGIISSYGIYSLVLVILTPLHDTPMKGISPPRLEEVGELFAGARSHFPSTPILLGCARPPGGYKDKVERLALRMGLNGIAYPGEKVIKLARRAGLKPIFSQYCCSLIVAAEALEH